MAKFFEAYTDKDPISYKAGETAVFTVRFTRKNDCSPDLKKMKWSIRGDDGNSAGGVWTFEKREPAILSATCTCPGFVHLVCNALDENGEIDQTVKQLDCGAGFDVDKIGYHNEDPADFEAYWDEIEKSIADFTPEIVQKEKVERWDVIEGVTVYDVRISTPEGIPASGFLSIPDAEGEYPLVMAFMGYGVAGAAMCMSRDCINLTLNAHGVENGIPNEEIERIHTELQYYGFNNKENASPYTSYWRNVMIRDLAGTKYAKSLEKWNGKDLICTGGSQGAFQATTVAAHDKDVTYLDICVPWFCDLNAINCGYMKGWRPDCAKATPYYDTVAQAKRVKCPVNILAGLGDYTCPPSGIMALYNTIPTSKRLRFVQNKTHGYDPEIVHNSFLYKNWERPEAGKVYKHYKGNEYEVLFVGKNSESAQNDVVYRKQSDAGEVWVRGEYMWTDLVITKNGVEKRFAKK